MFTVIRISHAKIKTNIKIDIHISIILSVPPEERRKGGIGGGGIPLEEKVRRK